MATDQDGGPSSDNLLGGKIHSFIIKLWREETGKGERPKWRGHITHVPSNERRYLKSLSDITDFVKTYLQCMGIPVDRWWRLKQWIRDRKQC